MATGRLQWQTKYKEDDLDLTLGDNAKVLLKVTPNQLLISL